LLRLNILKVCFVRGFLLDGVLQKGLVRRSDFSNFILKKLTN